MAKRGWRSYLVFAHFTCRSLLAVCLSTNDSRCESIAGLWCRFWKVISPQITGIGRQNSVLFGLVELLTFVKGICPSPCFAFSLFVYCSKVRTTCKSAWRHAKQEWKPPVERSLGEDFLCRDPQFGTDQQFELLTARTGGTYSVKVCRQGKCDNARLQKAVRQASVWVRCIRLWPSRLVGY